LAEELRDEDGKIEGVTLNYVGGFSVCSTNSSRAMELKIHLKCLKDIDFNPGPIGGDECVPELTYYSKYGCEIFTYDKFAVFVNSHYVVFGLTLLFLGIFLASFGNKFIDTVVFIIGTFVGFIAFAYLIFT